MRTGAYSEDYERLAAAYAVASATFFEQQSRIAALCGRKDVLRKLAIEFDRARAARAEFRQN